MVTEIVLCRHCQSQNVIKHGVIKHGPDQQNTQRFRCHDCARTFQKPEADRSYTPAFRAQVLASYQERASMRGVARIFGISRLTLADWLKKSQNPAASGADIEARSGGGCAGT
jgi:transposase-like protein